MTRRLVGVIRDGKFIRVNDRQKAPEVNAPFVHDDTLDRPIRNLVNGKMYDSTSAYVRSVKAAGCDIVGNDLMSSKPRATREVLTDEKIMDGIERAEAIHSDPFKLNQHRNMNIELFERNERLLQGRR